MQVDSEHGLSEYDIHVAGVNARSQRQSDGGGKQDNNPDYRFHARSPLADGERPAFSGAGCFFAGCSGLRSEGRDGASMAFTSDAAAGSEAVFSFAGSEAACSAS
ncbi:hypothetical protein ESCNG_30109 [Neisseria gonorrhoeae]|nr:hypothetical protein ESCNG_30109 [Neisseria gonorrhoeae]SCW15915.1 hypothetical protein ESCNG_30031 [Neisseria gonorrhoeae]